MYHTIQEIIDHDQTRPDKDQLVFITLPSFCLKVCSTFLHLFYLCKHCTATFYSYLKPLSVKMYHLDSKASMNDVADCIMMLYN